MQVFIIASIFNLQYNFNCPYYYIQLTQIINRLCQEYWIAKMKSADKTDHLNRLEAFIIWENHKQNNANKPLWWLINPTKKEFNKFNNLCGNHRKLKTEFIFNWRKKYKHDLVINTNKQNSIQFNYNEFFFSTAENILKNASTFARLYFNIDIYDLRTIKHCMRSQLFKHKHRKKCWWSFEVTMGGLSSVEVCYIVRTRIWPIKYTGLW